MTLDYLTWWEKFKLNLTALYQYATFWVVTIWGLIIAYWETMMTDAEHQAFFDAIPFGLGKLAPFVLFVVSYFAAHGWPQPKLEKKLEVAKIEAVIAAADKRDSGPL